MATSPVTANQKANQYTVSVNYVSADGTWKTAKSEREFSQPETQGKITVKIVDDDGKTEKSVERGFDKTGLVVTSAADLLSLLEKNPNFVLATFNYGADLICRNVIKAPIAAEVEGPGKAIQKMANQLFDSRAKIGKPISREKALKLAQMAHEIDADSEESAGPTSSEASEPPAQSAA